MTDSAHPSPATDPQPLRILVPLEDPGAEESLVRFAAALARTRSGELHLTHIATAGSDTCQSEQLLARAAAIAAEQDVPASPHLVQTPNVTDGILETVSRWECNMMVMGWYHEVQRDAVLASANRVLAKAISVDTLIYKNRNSDSFKRILVPTGGGNNALMGIQIAHELSRYWGAPVEVLRVARDPQCRRDDPILQRYCGQLRADTRLQLELLGIDVPVAILPAVDVVSPIVAHAREGDLVVLGASNDWRQEEFLAGSIPDEIANRVPASVLMVRFRTPDKPLLSSILWENTVRLDMHPTDKWDAIAQMVDSLVDARQVPSSQRDRVLERAVERERQGSTDLGHETAIPHAPIPELPGVIGCLGICPDGVDFEGLYDEPVRYIFLLLTPRQNYVGYIPVLAQIARLMKKDSTRAAILGCQTPAEVTGLIKQQERA